MKPAIRIVLLLLLSVTQLAAQTGQALKTYFSTLAANGQFNGNVLVAQNGETVYEQSFGYADFENRIANKKTTAFAIASITKTITATAVLQLVHSGKIRVGDAVRNYLPWFPYGNITVRHLLSHTSGLPPYNAFFDSLRRQQPGKVFSNADVPGVFSSNPKPLLYQPGERGNYDNVNFLVLALLVEKVSGMPYAGYIQVHVLRPANMRSTALVPPRVQYGSQPLGRLAHPYLYPHRYSDSMVRASRVPYVASYWSAYNFSGFGDYVSTVGDLLNYDRAYYSGKLLPASLQAEMFTPVPLNDGKANPGNFGLGWQVWTDTSLGKVVFHSGNATGLSCVLIRNLSKHQTIVVFDNIHSNAQSAGFAALRLLNGISLPPPKKSLVAAYGKMLVKQGSAAARNLLNRLKSDSLHYYLSEDEMNSLGYDLMGGVNNPNPFRFPEAHKYAEALEVFRLNTELFPDSWNAYDSYGEILFTLGRKAEAIAMYKRSLALNPQNENGKKFLEQLQAK